MALVVYNRLVYEKPWLRQQDALRRVKTKQQDYRKESSACDDKEINIIKDATFK